MKSCPKKKSKLTIGGLANAAGVRVATVRYYQKRGLLPLPDRPQCGGFRVYRETILERLLQIRKAQELGFTLSEIAELLAHIDQGNCIVIKALTYKKLQDIRDRIGELKKVQKTLAALAEKCPEDCIGACPLIRELCDTQVSQNSGSFDQ